MSTRSISIMRRVVRHSVQGLAALLILLAILLTSAATLLSTQWGSRWVLGQVSTLVNSESLALRYTTVRGSLLGGLVVEQPGLRLDGSRINADSLELVWQPWSALQGTLVIDRVHAAGLEVDWISPPAPAEPPGPGAPLQQQLDALLPLPLGLRLRHLGADNMALRVDGSELPLRSLRLGVTLQERRLTIRNLEIQTDPGDLEGTLAVTLDGNLPLEAELDWRTTEDALPTAALAGHLTLEGDLNSLTVDHRVQAPVALHSSGTVSPALADRLNQAQQPDPVRLDMIHRLSGLSLQQLLPDSTDLPPMSVASLELVSRGTPEDLALSGQFRADVTPPGATDPLPLEADWSSHLQGQRWTLEELALASGVNRINLTGSADWQDIPDIVADLELDLPEPGALYPLPAGLTLEELRSSAGLTVRLPDTGMDATVDLRELSARVNEQPLTGAGRIGLQDNTIDIDSLEIRSGESRLRADGSLGESLDAAFELTVPDIATLYAPASGAISARASVSGTPARPGVQGTAEIDSLQLRELSLDRLTMQGELDGEDLRAELQLDGLAAAGQRIRQASASAEGRLDGHRIQLEAAGTPGSLALSLDGGLDDGTWQGRLLESSVQSDLGRWVQEAPVALSAGSDVQLDRLCWRQDPARLCMDARLADDRIEANLALKDYTLDLLNHDAAGEILRRFHDGALPSGHQPAADGVFIPFRLPDPLAVTGSIDLEASANGPLSQPDQLQVDAGASMRDLALYIQPAETDTPLPEPVDNAAQEPPSTPPVEQIRWEEAALNASLRDGTWQADANMIVQQDAVAGSGVAMRGTTDVSLQLDGAGELDASVDLAFDDIAWLEALVPQLQSPRGELRGTLTARGPLQSPALGAELDLIDGGASVPLLGLQLEAVELALRNPEPERFVLTAGLQSGDGRLTLDSEILRPLEEQRSLQVTVSGEQFVVADLPDLRASISPDIQLSGNTAGLELSGELLIPMLDVTIEELPESAVGVSADTVIVNEADGVRNAALVDRGPLQEVPIRGDIRISLGDQVRFRGFGLDAGLTGALDITQRPEATPLAYGELQVVNGQFEMYGQSLQIEQGQLQFLGSYNNPALDIRAVRTVANTRVGVQINGTALSMRSRLFSTPALPDADVLAMLVTGRPLSEAGEQESPSLVGAVARLGINQGQGLTDQIRGQLGLDTLALDAGRGGDLQDSSLTLGKYLTPRIFVRYAVGLFETENTLAIEYTLTDALKLEAQSGEAQSLDVIYEMER